MPLTSAQVALLETRCDKFRIARIWYLVHDIVFVSTKSTSKFNPKKVTRTDHSCFIRDAFLPISPSLSFTNLYGDIILARHRACETTAAA
jgi:hypothetical protein